MRHSTGPRAAPASPGRRVPSRPGGRVLPSPCHRYIPPSSEIRDRGYRCERWNHITMLRLWQISGRLLTKGSIAVGNPERRSCRMRSISLRRTAINHDCIQPELRSSLRLYAADAGQQQRSIRVPPGSHSNGHRVPGAGHQLDLWQRLEQHQSAHWIRYQPKISHPAS